MNKKKGILRNAAEGYFYDQKKKLQTAVYLHRAAVSRRPFYFAGLFKWNAGRNK